ncbi:hypothetical protein ACIA98_42825 [Streptomyces sp. NPDC051366]|uniref:hypothetical protein n=1 Tax=Streptomyces sp. NPDC051366 TaxID=3365652 RepID=UPI003787ECE0
MSARRPSRTADNGGEPTSVIPHPPLPPEDDEVVVGDQVVAAAAPAARQKRRRPAFGSYMDTDLQRRFKARCVIEGIEMQDALAEAVTLWLDRRQDSDQQASQLAN